MKSGDDIKMTIRAIQKSDYPKIAGLIMNELGYPEQNCEDIYKRLGFIEKDNRYHTLVACIDNQVVGFIGLCKIVTYEKGEYINILAFAVADKYQGQGIGKALLASTKTYACENKIKQIRVSSALHREETHLFYVANGFERTSYAFIMEM